MFDLMLQSNHMLKTAWAEMLLLLEVILRMYKSTHPEINLMILETPGIRNKL